MIDITHPTKESVREYMERRTQQSCEPPPAPEEIRRQLGWHMLPVARWQNYPERDSSFQPA